MVNCTGSLQSDIALINSVLGNLLGNAIRYTDKGSVLLGCQREGRQLRIDVIDTGIGIAKQELPLIFDDFYQINNSAQDSRQGFGLGLPIVKQFSALLEHQLSVTSAPGKGSRFSITVPFRPADDAPVEEQTFVLNRLLVLLVEDDAAVLDSTTVFLRALGAQVLAAKTSEQALAKAATCVDLDLIICDFQLPGTNGVQLVKRIRSMLGKDVPALIMTGDVAAAEPAAAALPNHHWLQKPVDLDQLMTCIDTAVVNKANNVMA